MNQEAIMEMVFAIMKRRWRAFIIAMIVLVPLDAVIVRKIDQPYVAQIRLYAMPTGNNSVLDGKTSLIFGGSTSMERDALLQGQETLLKSTRVFDAIKTIDLDLNPDSKRKTSKLDFINAALGTVQEYIFGNEYVQIRQRWKNREFNLFKRNISVNVDSDTASIIIKYSHLNPQTAIIAVKKAAEILQEINTEISKKQSAKRVKLLEEKIEESKIENDKISAEITSFIRKNKISSDPRTIDPKYKGIAGALELIDGAKLEISQREIAITEIKKVNQTIKSEIDQGLLNDREGRLKSLTGELRHFENAMSKLDTSTINKTRLNLKKQIAEVRSKIAVELSKNGTKMDLENLQNLLKINEENLQEHETGLIRAKSQLEFGKLQSNKYEKELAQIPELSEELAKLTLIQSQQRKVLEQLTQRFLESQIERDTKQDQFYITEDPTLADSDKLGKMPLLLTVFALSLILFAAMMVIIDYLRGVILTKNQLTKFQTPQYLGSVPFESQLNRRRNLSVISEIGVGFRLAHALKKNHYDSSQSSTSKVIAVTSKSARVGKTVTSYGIATSMQTRGLRTIVIDADYLAKERSLSNQMTEHVTKLTSIDIKAIDSNTIIKRNKLTFWSIADEFKQENLINDFLLNDFKYMVDKLKIYYDCIVIDCAPCFVTTMLLVYELADIHILCFAEGASTNSDILQVTEIVSPACKENAKIYSTLTMTKLKANSIAPKGSDGIYYQMNKVA